MNQINFFSRSKQQSNHQIIHHNRQHSFSKPMIDLSLIPVPFETTFYSSQKSSSPISPTYLPFIPESYCLFDFQVKDQKGNLIHLRRYLGKKAYIVVNVFTAGAFKKRDYREFQELLDVYEEDLEILAFPCTDFGAKELLNSHPVSPTISPTSRVSDKVYTFPVFHEISCESEENIHPLYDFLKKTAPPRYAPMEWDFVKFLCDANGKVVARYPPECSPKDMESDILRLINDESNYYRPKTTKKETVSSQDRKYTQILYDNNSKKNNNNNNNNQKNPVVNDTIHTFGSLNNLPILSSLVKLWSPVSYAMRRLIPNQSAKVYVV